MISTHKTLVITRNMFLVEGIKKFLEENFKYLSAEVTAISCEDILALAISDDVQFNLVVLDIPGIPDVNFFSNTYGVLKTNTLTLKSLRESVRQTINKKISLRKKYLSDGGLSKRESEYLRLTANGYSERTISRKMNITCKTVSTHRRNVRIKMGLQNRNQLIQFISLLSAI